MESTLRIYCKAWEEDSVSGNLERERTVNGAKMPELSPTDIGIARTKNGSIKGDVISAHTMLLDSRKAAGPPSYQLVSKDRVWWLQTWPYILISSVRNCLTLDKCTPPL